MQREQKAGEPRAGNVEALEHSHEEPRARRVQRDVHEVIAERRVAPESMKNPERRVSDRIVLLCRADGKPDAPQTRDRLQRRFRQVAIVIPQQAAVPNRTIRGERDDDECAEEPQTGGVIRARCDGRPAPPPTLAWCHPLGSDGRAPGEVGKHTRRSSAPSVSDRLRTTRGTRDACSRTLLYAVFGASGGADALSFAICSLLALI